ncbi:MAG: hypothetical protein QW587_04730 [Candidatus Bathyarchaeia archaeon]
MSHPIDDYLEAVESYRSKDRASAALKIAKAIGGVEATPPILSSLDKILDKKTVIHGAVLDAIVSEARKRRREAS